MRSSVLATSLTTALLAAGCFGHVGYTAGVSNEGYAPELVEAAPGVQVIADYDDSIFFADSFYWRFDAGWWYRSPRYDGGWSRAVPPSPLQRIDQPRGYVHYRPQGWVSRRERAPQASMNRSPPPRAVQQPPPRAYQAPQAHAFQPPSPRSFQPPPRSFQPPPRGEPPPAHGPQPQGNRPQWRGGEHGERGDDRDHRDRR
jgi:hypothetical protein